MSPIPRFAVGGNHPQSPAFLGILHLQLLCLACHFYPLLARGGAHFGARLWWWVYHHFQTRQSQHTYGPDIYISDGRLIWLTCTVEQNSLAPKNDNVYVKKWRHDVETLCGAKFQVRLLGEHATQDKKVCRCRKPTSYILWTNFISRVSPLDCGDCGGNVPLYRIPKPSEPDSQEYNFVHHWEKAYQACDEIQMDCGFGERWGERQMQEHTSGLSQRGRDACQQIEKATGVPVYYYLGSRLGQEVRNAL